MDVKWDAELKDGQSANPVLHWERMELPEELICPTDDQLAVIFKTNQYRLQTWSRQKKNGKTVLTNDPHWLATRGSGPLHVDPKYPRYSHQLKIRVDDGIFARGLDKVEVPLFRGVYYVLDTHSPHQVFSPKVKNGYNVTVSIDHHIPLRRDKTVARLSEWGIANSHRFTEDVTE